MANIISSGDKLEDFPVRSRSSKIKERLSPFITPFQHCTKSLANAKKKKNKRHTDWEGRNKCVCLQMT